MIALSSVLRSRSFWDQILVAGLSVYALGLFLPGITALQNLGLYSALLVSMMGGRWRACLAGLGHPLLLLTLGLVAWFALSTAWSVDPATTFRSVTSVFKDYFLIIPPMLYLLSIPEYRRLFARALALAGLVIVVLNGAQYVEELARDPALLANIKLHRGWGHPLMYFLPFALMQTRTTRGREAKLWFVLFAIEAAMIIATGARGAWLALFALLVLWGWHDYDRRHLARLAVATVLLALVAYFALPASIVRDRIAKGMDTSLRTSGTWGPALDMLRDRPGLGYGFGKEIFNREFNERAPAKAEWTIKKSIGPHSIFLEAGFSGGYPALLAIAALFLAAVGYGQRAVAGAGNNEDRMFALAATSSFVAFYLVRGSFESVRWGPLIILVLAIVYFSVATRNQRLPPPT